MKELNVCWKRFFVVVVVVVASFGSHFSSTSDSHFTFALGPIFCLFVCLFIILIESLGGWGEFYSHCHLLENKGPRYLLWLFFFFFCDVQCFASFPTCDPWHPGLVFGGNVPDAIKTLLKLARIRFS